MSYLDHSTSTNRSPFNQRIMANLSVQASWVDAVSGETILVKGVTENVGETSTLVNLEVLPPVGSEVQLRIFEEDEQIIEVPTHVIRVERDPSQPLAANIFARVSPATAVGRAKGKSISASTNRLPGNS